MAAVGAVTGAAAGSSTAGRSVDSEQPVPPVRRMQQPSAVQRRAAGSGNGGFGVGTGSGEGDSLVQVDVKGKVRLPKRVLYFITCYDPSKAKIFGSKVVSIFFFTNHNLPGYSRITCVQTKKSLFLSTVKHSFYADGYVRSVCNETKSNYRKLFTGKSVFSTLLIFPRRLIAIIGPTPNTADASIVFIVVA